MQGEENCFLFGPLDRKELDLREESVGGQLVVLATSLADSLANL